MANTRYENIVLQDKLTEALKTAISISNYITMDDSLTEAAGMTKRVNTYRLLLRIAAAVHLFE